MVNIKIDKVDNGFVVSYVKPPNEFTKTGPEQVVTVHTTFDDVIKTLTKEFK